VISLLPKDYHLVKAHVGGGEARKLCWRESRLLAGSPKPDRSKGRSQTKCSPLVLIMRQPRFFKNCRATEEGRKEGKIRNIKSLVVQTG
jgi:hypothetical protein